MTNTTKLFTDLNTEFFANLSDHDWNILSARWSHGSDWCVREVQSWVQIFDCFGVFPRFTTVDFAMDTLDDCILTESRRRALAR